jgi:hypothetical protein
LVAGSSVEQHLNAVSRSILNTRVFPDGIEWVSLGNSSEFPEVGQVIEDSDSSDMNEQRINVWSR